MASKSRDNLVKRLIARDGDQCFYCCNRFQRAGHGVRTLEHVVPRREGGSNREENLVLACMLCNNLRGHKPVFVFVRECRRVRKGLDDLERFRHAVERAMDCQHALENDLLSFRLYQRQNR